MSNAHITQELQLIVNAAITENQRFCTTEIDIDIAHIANITHEIQLLSKVLKETNFYVKLGQA